MSEDVVQFLLATVIGVGATFCMDLWAMLGRRVFGVVGLNWCLVGRWIAGFVDGRLVSDNTGTGPERTADCVLGWIAHYGVGITLSVVFVAVVGESWLVAPTLWPALLFGWVSVVLPFFLMQPGLGAGIAGSRTPNPSRVRFRSLVTHTVYGPGLFVSAKFVSLL